MRSLQRLSISYANLQGPGPAWSAPSLEHLVLSHNNLTGAFPQIEARLRTLDVSYNNLNDTLFSDLNGLPVEYLSFEGNKFRGTLPAGAQKGCPVLHEQWHVIAQLQPTGHASTRRQHIQQTKVVEDAT